MCKRKQGHWELTFADVTSETPTPRVVGTTHMMARPVANALGVRGRSRTAKARTGVKPTIEANANSVPGSVLLVKAVFSSSVFRVSPEMKKTMQMFTNPTTLTSATCTGVLCFSAYLGQNFSIFNYLKHHLQDQSIRKLGNYISKTKSLNCTSQWFVVKIK